jgi:hypothetical protein
LIFSGTDEAFEDLKCLRGEDSFLLCNFPEPPLVKGRKGRLLVFFQNGFDLTVLIFPKYFYRSPSWSQGTGPQTVDTIESAGLCGPSGFHLQPVLKIVENSGASSHMARCSQAHLNGMFSLGLKAEGLIESGHFVNACKGDVKAFGHLNQCLSRKIVHFCLKILKNTDKGSLLKTMPFNDFANKSRINLHLSFSPGDFQFIQILTDSIEDLNSS